MNREEIKRQGKKVVCGRSKSFKYKDLQKGKIFCDLYNNGMIFASYYYIFNSISKG